MCKLVVIFILLGSVSNTVVAGTSVKAETWRRVGFGNWRKG